MSSFTGKCSSLKSIINDNRKEIIENIQKSNEY